MMYACFITTKDNPFDPFEQFDEWNLFDKEKGYNSCERVARLANYSDDMTEEESDREFERAIDKLISIDFLDIFRKIRVKTQDSDTN